jgi:hypothetical protein
METKAFGMIEQMKVKQDSVRSGLGEASYCAPYALGAKQP